jgi:TonB-dependent SusC/RagA subfamily outer membrane receptor
MGLYAQKVKQESKLSADSSQVTGIQTGYAGDFGSSMSPTFIYMDGQHFTNELSVYEFLQGRIAGLEITQSSGDAGKNGTASIRRQGTPLIVIDGILQCSLDEYSQNRLNEDIRSLIPVALSDLQSIEVLKDGFAAALYGTEGINGVILIHTKKGKAQKARLTYQYNQSFHAEPEYPKMLSGEQYVMYQLEAYHNSYGGTYIPPQLAYDRDYYNYYNFSANTNWIGAVTQPGHASDHYLGFTGGNKTNRVYGAINYLSQTGTIINTGYNRFINRINFEHDFSTKLAVGIQVANSYAKHDENPVLLNSYGLPSADVLETAFVKAPNVSIWEYDINGNGTGKYFNSVNNYQNHVYNPVALSALGNATDKLQVFNPSAHIQYKINNWLQLRESFSIMASSKVSDACVPLSVINGDYSFVGNDTCPHSKISFWQFRNELQTFLKLTDKNVNRNSLEGYLTWITQSLDRNFNEIEGFETFDDKIQKNAAVVSIQYRFLDCYLLTANTRAEYFTSGDLNTWDNHYGLSAGWRFTSEDFIKGINLLNNGIIYAGWSYSDYHPFLETFLLTDKQYVKSFNAGMDMTLLSDRIHLGVNWFNKNIYSENVLPSLKEYDYSGLELNTDLEMVKSLNLSWKFNFNLISVNQKINTIYNPDNSIIYNNQYLVESTGSIFGFIFDGIYSTDAEATAINENGEIILDENAEPVMMSYQSSRIFKAGDVKYRDIDHNGNINSHDMVYLGNTFPKYTGGFGSTVRFKNLSLTCNFHYRAGYKIIDVVGLSTESANSKNNMSSAILNRWRSSELPGAYPKPYLDDPINALLSNRYVKSGNFVKLNYVNLSYDVNSDFCRRIHLTGLTLNVSAQRLFTIADYNGLDPEIEINYDPYSLNRDNIRTLPSKIITFSLQMTL